MTMIITLGLNSNAPNANGFGIAIQLAPATLEKSTSPAKIATIYATIIPINMDNSFTNPFPKYPNRTIKSAVPNPKKKFMLDP